MSAVAEITALAAFTFVSAATPGPNNVMLWASGVQFGLRATMPHVLGTSIGVALMSTAVAAGLGVVITGVPEIELALKITGSIYLLFLAYRVAGSTTVRRADVSGPLSLAQAAAFQFVNPKAWFFVLAALTTFRPEGLHVVVGSSLMVMTMAIVVFPSVLIWAAGGTALNRFVTGPRVGRAVGIGLAVILAATVIWIWS